MHVFMYSGIKSGTAPAGREEGDCGCVDSVGCQDTWPGAGAMILLEIRRGRLAALVAKGSTGWIAVLLGCRISAHHLLRSSSGAAYSGFIPDSRGLKCHSRLSELIMRVGLFCVRDRIRASRGSTR